MTTYFSPFLRVCVLVVFALLVMLLNDDYGAKFLVHGEELGLEKKMTMAEKKKKLSSYRQFQTSNPCARVHTTKS